MKAPLSPCPLSPLKGERGVDSKDVKKSNFEGWANERMRARHLRSQGGYADVGMRARRPRSQGGYADIGNAKESINIRN